MSVKESCDFLKFSLTPKVLSLKTCLHQCVAIFEDLNIGFDQICIQADTYKSELMAQKEKCDSKKCQGSEAIKQKMFAKETIIRTAVLYLKKLSNSSNSNGYGELLKILHGEPAILTPPKDHRASNIINTETSNVRVKMEDEVTPFRLKKEIVCKKDLSSSMEDVSFKEDSISEIDATPTGRRSPVIRQKKFKKITNETDSREKKKCPEEWPSPNAKAVKIKFKSTTPVKTGRGRGRMRQGRLPWGIAKTPSVVDLTASPDSCASLRMRENLDIQKLIKKESSENDDTILPSPTSGPTTLIFGCSTTKENTEFRRALSLISRGDKTVSAETKPITDANDREIEDMEVSINILQPNRLPRHHKHSPIKVKQEAVDDVTHCDTLASVSLIHNIERMETDHHDLHGDNYVSLVKQPLVDNINIGNVPSEASDTESSMSILSSNASAKMSAESDKRKTPEKVEPMYKEPTVRKKAEKMALPGWVCDECKNFFGVLYKDDPDMVEKAVGRCSKHRGRSDPARPATPPGYWQPRWTVPDNTEEFNKRNNAE